MTTAVVILSIVLGVVVLVSLLGEGKRSSLDSKIFELKAENYTLTQQKEDAEKRNAKLQADMLNLKAAWHHMKSTLPFEIDQNISQEKKSGETSS